MIKSIVPGGPDLDITLPIAYRITGNVIDGDGNPLKALIGIRFRREQSPGEFKLYNVLPGTYTLKIAARDYPEVVRPVTVYDSDVDLGDIVLDDKGIIISGRLVTPDNRPAENAHVTITSKTTQIRKSEKTDKDGCFQIKGLSRNISYIIRASRDMTRCEYQTGELSTDTDIGDLVLKPLPFYSITIVDTDGIPVSVGYINNQKISNNGIWQGYAHPTVSNLKFSKKRITRDTISEDIYKIPITPGTDVTNTITATIPAEYLE